MGGTQEVKDALLAIAKEFTQQGPGFAQEPVVLREAMHRLNIKRNLRDQQRLLNVWHDLFRTGALYWGYDIENPGQPFFHFPES